MWVWQCFRPGNTSKACSEPQVIPGQQQPALPQLCITRSPQHLQVRAAHGACSPGCLRCGSLHLQNQSSPVGSPEGQTCPGAAAPCPGWCLLSPTARQDHPARREEQEEGSQVPSLHARKCCEERGAHRAAQMQLLQLSASPAVAAERIAIQTHF